VQLVKHFEQALPKYYGLQLGLENDGRLAGVNLYAWKDLLLPFHTYWKASISKILAITTHFISLLFSTPMYFPFPFRDNLSW
jgi:hypothetical protein